MVCDIKDILEMCKDVLEINFANNQFLHIWYEYVTTCENKLSHDWQISLSVLRDCYTYMINRLRKKQMTQHM